MEVDTAPQLPQPQVAPTHQPPNHHSSYSPPIAAAAKPTLPLPTSHSPREATRGTPSLTHSRRASAAGLKDASHASVQSPHHVVPVTNGLHPPNGQYYSHQSETLMDSLSRVQTVTSLNQASLEAQHRKLDGQAKDIERLEGMFTRLQQDVRGIQEMLESIRNELRHRPVGGAASMSANDETLELFAKNLTNMSAKVQEVEGVKMQVEIMKRKLTRLEEGATAPHSGVSYSSPRDSALLTTTSIHSTASVPKINTPIRPDVRPLGGAPYHHTPPEISHNVEQEQQSAGGWVSVNSSGKRGYTNGVESRADSASYTPGSPKRPKLAPMEPQVNMDPRSHISYERMDTDEEYSRTHSRDSYGEAGATPSTYVPYSAQSTNPEDNWRSEPQRGQEQRSPKRGGRGSGRVGRPRKSLPADYEMGTPEWEKPEWTGSQAGPDGYYQPVTPGGSKRSSLVRRGSGGAGNSSTRSIAIEHEMPRQQQHDPYAHTKKTRTKPTRNAEGVLIRKDGRPDMRSHSSAANLRKVHARKEQERAMEQGLAVQNSAAPPSNASVDTPSPNDSGNTETSTTQDRHQAIMKQMFPHGVDESRERMNYTSRLFPAVNSPTYPSGSVKSEGNTRADDSATPENEREHERAMATRGTSAASDDRPAEKRSSHPPRSASPERNPDAHKN